MAGRSMKGANNPSFKHGCSTRAGRTNIYRRWGHMIQRCHNPNDADYPMYGGQGIVVCAEWRESFVQFLADMGMPSPKMSLERKDNKGPYNKENCVWATPRTQANNRSSTKMLTIKGTTLALSYWCDIAGIGSKAVLYRLKIGMSHEDAVFKPVSHSNKFNKT